MSAAGTDWHDAILPVLGRQVHAAVVAVVSARDDDPPSIWFDRALPGDDQEAEVLSRFARTWLACRGTSDAATEVIEGWDVVVEAIGADAALLLARGPSNPWSDAERPVIHFAARLCTRLGDRTAATRMRYPDVDQPAARFTGVDGLHVLDAVSGEPLSAYVVGVDGLTVVNDVLGYAVGNALLGVIEDRLVEWAHGAGATAALGGARFAALRTDVADEQQAFELAQQLAKQLARPCEIAGARVSRPVSIGVAHAGGTRSTGSELIARAVDALRHARAAGGSTVRVFDAGAQERLLARFRTELALHGAVADGSLRLVYQPEFDLRTGALHSVEALLRWQHPERGLLNPAEFIDVAEESDAIGEIGAWIIDEACSQLAAWQRGYPDLPLVMRVNLAAVQLTRHDAVGKISDALARYALRGEQLCTEITERAMPADLAPLAAQLATLRSLGVTVAIDDFGTDHSTFVHLNVLPVDTIKIDKGFVSGMHTDSRSAAIVAALVRLARTFGIDVVAEGVDTPEVIDELIALGCFRAQGNLLSPARPPEEIVPILRAGGRTM